ncbi:hypothetical protein LCM17_08430 [Cereibacter sphaeroides]|nr:hypothetical protein [Cereibacter sphaeroides]
MNRVRIVAVAAVAMGAAVVAGTKFQQSREAAMMQAMPAEGLSTASVLPGVGGTAPTASTPSAAPSLIASAEESSSDMRPVGRIAVPVAPSIASPEPQAGATPSIAAPVTQLADARSLAPAEPLQRASVVPNAEDVATVSPAPGVLPRQLPPVATAPLPLDTPRSTDLTSDTPLDSDLRAELEACAVWLVVTPAPGAMLETSVYAPCDSNAVVHLDHAGLQFDAQLGADGQLLAQIPALTSDAEVTLSFIDGRSQSDRTTVPDLSAMERVVLQWAAPVALELNAYEFGADWGDAGHVSSRQPHQPGIAGQGFLTALGDPAIAGGTQAQVYSYPRGETPQTGRVSLEIEVPVTDASCGKALSANTIELHGDGAAQIRTLRLDMPDCDGAGGYVVLPGVLPELQIALNQG